MALSNVQLSNIAKKNGIRLNAIVCKDELYHIKPKLGFYIFNLDNSSGDGTHWVCGQIKPKYSIYVDPFGVYPPTEIQDFLQAGHRSIMMNNTQIENINSDDCGLYCLFFIDKLANGQDLSTIIHDFSGPEQKKYNDNLVESYFNRVKHIH
jgi:hypothetical protein